jgi:MFS family permease
MAAALPLLPWSLVAGRALEGLVAGISLPLMFLWVARGRGFGTPGQRISIFNALFALGFVVGPPLVSLLVRLSSSRGALVALGLPFPLLALALAVAQPQGCAEETSARLTAPASWFDSFYLLFLAKCSYGFLLSYITSELADALAPLGISQILLLLSAVFIVGQALANPLLRRIGGPTARMQGALLLVFAVLLLGLRLTGAAWLLFPAGLVHSLVLFVGVLLAAQNPGSAREFALVNSLSDPGMILGAAFDGLGANGLFALAALALIPLGRRKVGLAGLGLGP